MRIHLPILITLGLLLSACNPRLIPYPEPAVTLPAAESPAAVVTPGAETDKAVSLVIANLSMRLSIDARQVELVRIEAALWPDSSLGCPQPGKAYADVIVPGYRVHLRAGGQEYVYHTDAGSQAILCEPDDQLPSFPVTPGDIDDGEPWMPVE
jgi:hypothetical protein